MADKKENDAVKAGSGDQPVVTDHVKYVYIKIADFQIDRSIEAQAAIINCLKSCIQRSAENLAIEPHDVSYLPAGEEICIALFGRSGDYDIHMRMIIDVMSKLTACNRDQSDARRTFELQVGINEDVDVVVEDINSQRNVAGPGVELARTMANQAGNNQILVGNAVFDNLKCREQYIDQFEEYTIALSGKREVSVYQYIDPQYGFLNHKDLKFPGTPKSTKVKGKDSE